MTSDMSGAGPSQDGHARGAKPSLEEDGRARGREADTPTSCTYGQPKEAEANCAPSEGSAGCEPDGPPRGRTPECEARALSAQAASVGAHVVARARRVRLLTCDVDGVLTDGRIYIDDQGRELKVFSALDGVAMHRLAAAGIVVAWITGSGAPAVAHRAQQLRIAHLVQDAQDKLGPWQRLRAELGLSAEACAHIGDDLPDIAVLTACGLSATVPHAPSAVRAHAHYVTTREGGAGAVRELADLILSAQGYGEAQDIGRARSRAAVASR